MNAPLSELPSESERRDVVGISPPDCVDLAWPLLQNRENKGSVSAKEPNSSSYRRFWR